MKVNYQYASPSMCIQGEGQTTLGLSPDLCREERVSFQGRLKEPLCFRDAMLMLRQIVISDMGQQKKDRTEYFAWLTDEIDRRTFEYKQHMLNVRGQLEGSLDETKIQLRNAEKELAKLQNIKHRIDTELSVYDIWKDYHKIERDFWSYIREKDYALWFVLDPVITVHPDQVSFEAFSIDESTYGCLSVPMEAFEMLKPPVLGTTNIDFSAKLAREMERFRTYTDVTLSINPDGFTADTGVLPPHIEKKIDLPETWIKGFNQVSAAASLNGTSLMLSTIDMYDICCFLRRYKENKSPRYMKWILHPNKPVQICFEPFGTILTLKAVYQGDKPKEEKIWGRRRWLVMEKLIPISKSFEIRLLGFGLPQFIIADLGGMKMTIGFSSWSSNDWVKGTAFQVMAGFIGNGNYDQVYTLLKKERMQTLEQIYKNIPENNKSVSLSGIGMLLRRGEGYFDPVQNAFRFRQLCSTPIPPELYTPAQIEIDVKNHLKQGMDKFRLSFNHRDEYVFWHSFKENAYSTANTELIVDQDGQIVKLKCSCRDYNIGARNISAPCSHILALYLLSAKFLKLDLEHDKEYTINDIMEVLL